MFTAYVDETVQEQQENWMFVAGYVGHENSWKSVEQMWRAAIAPRKHLHMKSLRFSRESERLMLLRAAEVPKACGLEPIFGGVRQRDYTDLVRTEEGRLLSGYVLCCYPMLIQTLWGIPENERLEVVFARQDRYGKIADLAMSVIARTQSDANMLMSDGTHKLARWRFVSPETSPDKPPSMNELADCFAYALLQAWRDRRSIKAQWTKPILDAHNNIGYGAIMDRSKIRKVINDARLMQLMEDARDARFRGLIRGGRRPSSKSRSRLTEPNANR